MKVTIPYGKKDVVEVEIPDKNLIGVYETQEGEPIKNEKEAFERVLNKPLGTKPLAEIAENKKNAVIAITDHSRPNIEKKALPFIIK